MPPKTPKKAEKEHKDEAAGPFLQMIKGEEEEQAALLASYRPPSAAAPGASPAKAAKASPAKAVKASPAKAARVPDVGGGVGLEYYSQENHLEFSQVIHGISEDDFDNTWPAILNGVVGRNGVRGVGSHSQWKTSVPFLQSLTCWVLTGNAYAPGNPHVKKYNHTVGGNLHTNVAGIDVAQVGKVVRSMFPSTYIEVDDYFKYMVIVDRGRARTYLVKIKWFHRVDADDIAVEVRSFNVAPIVHSTDPETLIDTFNALGFSD